MNCSRLFRKDFQVQPDTPICITKLSQKHLFLSQEVAFTKKKVISRVVYYLKDGTNRGVCMHARSQYSVKYDVEQGWSKYFILQFSTVATRRTFSLSEYFAFIWFYHNSNWHKVKLYLSYPGLEYWYIPYIWVIYQLWVH